MSDRQPSPELYAAGGWTPLVALCRCSVVGPHSLYGLARPVPDGAASMMTVADMIGCRAVSAPARARSLASWPAPPESGRSGRSATTWCARSAVSPSLWPVPPGRLRGGRQPADGPGGDGPLALAALHTLCPGPERGCGRRRNVARDLRGLAESGWVSGVRVTPTPPTLTDRGNAAVTIVAESKAAVAGSPWRSSPRSRAVASAGAGPLTPATGRSPSRDGSSGDT